MIWPLRLLLGKLKRVLLLLLWTVQRRSQAIIVRARGWLLSFLSAAKRRYLHSRKEHADDGDALVRPDTTAQPAVISASLVPPSAQTTRYSPLDASEQNPFAQYDSRPSSRPTSEDGKLDLTHGKTGSDSHIAVEMTPLDGETEAQLPILRGNAPRPMSAFDETQPNVAYLLEELREAGLRPMNPPWVYSRAGPWGWVRDPNDIIRQRVPRGPFRYKAEVDAELGLISPSGWIELLTPRGRPYFINPTTHFVTDMYIRRPDIYDVFTRWASRIRNLISALQKLPPSVFSWPENYEVFLYVESDTRCSYYMVSHEDRQVFWIENLRNMLPEGSRWWPSCRIDLWLQTQYWCHVAEFPHEAPQEVGLELQKTLISARLDVLTFPGSTSPFSAAECDGFLKDLMHLSEFDAEPSIKNAYVARLMRNITHNRLHYHHGEEGARSDRREPSYPARTDVVSPAENGSHKRFSDAMVLFDRVLVALLTFGATEMQMTILREANGIDNVIIPQSHSWKSYLDTSVRQAKDGNIVSALIFVANVAFLGIANLNTFMITLSAISTLWALFSFISGLLLIRQRDAKSDEAILHYSVLGLLGHAFLFSLPFAFLLWSVLTFSISLAVYIGLEILGGGVALVLALAFAVGLLATVALSFARPDWLLALLGFDRRRFWRSILSAPLSGVE